MINIGVLNIMHDKIDTKKRLDHIFKELDPDVNLIYYYPVDHYQNTSVPDDVAAIAHPLNFKSVQKLNAFIITGAPIDRKSFSEITYLNELHTLFKLLNNLGIEQLYMCWGAMAAMNYFYGITKQWLPNKLFGVYQHHLDGNSPLLNGMHSGFLAPHARYVEMNHEQIRNNEALKTVATTNDGMLFLNTCLESHQTFLFAHLEYDKDALQNEYQREINANLDDKLQIARPKNYFKKIGPKKIPFFSWHNEQAIFFRNWLEVVKTRLKVTE